MIIVVNRKGGNHGDIALGRGRGTLRSGPVAFRARTVVADTRSNASPRTDR